MPDQTASERLAELQAKKAAREAKRLVDGDAQELALLEAEQKYVDQNLERGRDFEIIDCQEHGEPVIVIKRGAAVVYTKFAASKMGPTDLDAFVTPNLLEPDVATYRAIVERRPQIAVRCGNAVATLYGVKKEADSGKF